ncbi:hypothetical protein DTO166G4_6519 [Paecilomyces variotii]|nr:hypothetical protein DTO166G4_6519 [Paecilomyces variotii]KAJ9225265.1 hypothetical protein DTO169C6_2295 [Paecilomyces variotii]KAJ9230379.1 hypothetical protein DTO166G5_7344 [Paecilomyces variotii]KAJ9247028.1 hypothetical protein DTO207G8_8413 [Paecilomyces variotii]KAJ9285510.1 hypothetical protein DTO021C3_6902 [Paecilomyces variotii]
MSASTRPNPLKDFGDITCPGSSGSDYTTLQRPKIPDLGRSDSFVLGEVVSDRLSQPGPRQNPDVIGQCQASSHRPQGSLSQSGRLRRVRKIGGAETLCLASSREPHGGMARTGA